MDTAENTIGRNGDDDREEQMAVRSLGTAVLEVREDRLSDQR